MTIRSTLAPLCLAALLAAGCAGATVPAPSETLLRDTLAQPDKGGLASAYSVDEAWWRGYGDGQLDRLVETTLANNLDLAQAAITMKKALLAAYRLGSDLQPSFSAGLSGSLRKDIKNGGHANQSYGGDVAVGYEIDLWKRLRDLRSAQEWEYHATAEDEAALRLALVNSVVDAYYHLAYLSDAVDAVMESMARYEQIETMTRTKYAAGKVDAVEPVMARQSYLAEKARLISYQSEQKTVEQTLRNLMNLKPSDLLDLSPPSLSGFAARAVDLDVPLSVLSNRPDLRAAEFRLRRAFKDLGATRKSLYPVVTIGGSITASNDKFGKAFDLPFAGGTVAVDFPFLQWNKIRWNIRISEAEYESVRVSFEQAVTTALNEVDTYAFDYANARETLANDQEKHANDLKVGDYYKTRYDTGANELSDWLDALNTISGSRLTVISDRYRIIQRENLLYKAMAGRYRPESAPAE